MFAAGSRKSRMPAALVAEKPAGLVTSDPGMPVTEPGRPSSWVDMKLSWVRTILRWLLGVAFVAAGTNHFLAPQFYLPLMPPTLPWPLALIAISGVAEILGGLGVLIPALRRWSGWGLIALLIAVFPANLYAAFHGLGSIPPWVLWARLPFQLVFIAWVYWTCLCPATAPAERNGAP